MQTGCRPSNDKGRKAPEKAALRRQVSDAPYLNGAGDEARTRYLDLGKVALYQMSYTRIM